MRSILFLFMLLLIGCATSQGPDVLLISQDEYAKAFDAAITVAKEDGLNPTLLDRRNGIIASTPITVGSVFEPWKPGASSPRQAMEGTLALQSRTARFEFRPMQAAIVPEAPMGELMGPNLLSGSGIDLTQHADQIELRVWVYVNRHHSVGVRRGTWSLRTETTSTDIPLDELWEQVPRRFWVPMTRDIARERALLASIESRLIGD